MIITKITGGLGNQMFQYAIAKSIAVKNNDKFELDISFYPRQTLRKYELNLFNIEENISKPEYLFTKVKRKLGFVSKEYYKEKEIASFDKNVFNYDINIILDGYWQNEDYFKDIRDDIIKDFTLKQEINSKAKKYLFKIKNNNSVSLHIRRGDYIKNSHHGTCNLIYYQNAINYIKKEVSNPIFYIFSDDIEWCKKQKIFENFFFIDNTKSALDDLILMINCKHNIIANSTFSWWGAWLNKNENKIVIAPKIWWNDMPNKSITCENWIKI